MNAINMPGFTAEALLPKSADRYRETWDSSRSKVNKVEPQTDICFYHGAIKCCLVYGR
jgi:hypothetical protein